LTGNTQTIARVAGWSLIASIVVGALSAIFVAQGIDINLSADVSATAKNMLQAEPQLRAKAYLGALAFGLGVAVHAGFFLLLRGAGPMLALWSLLIALTSAVLALLGSVFALNAAEIAGDGAYLELMGNSERLMLAALQASSDYTSFHLSLIIGSAANAGFFLLFFRSALIPKLIAGWGLFASLFVAIAIVARDFIPLIGSEPITIAFMLSNLIALVSTGAYLGLRGVRDAATNPPVNA